MQRPRRTPFITCILAGVLVLPSPAVSGTFEVDLNGDGTLNATDLFEFVRQWHQLIELEPTPTPTPRQIGGHPPAGLSDRSNLGPVAAEVSLEDYARVVHVAETGSDEQGDGSAENPWRTIPFALEQIADATASHRYAVLVAEGRYAGDTIEVREWVDLYGGFEPVGWTRDFDSHPTILDGEGERRVVSMAGRTRLDGFTVTGGNTTVSPDYTRGAGVLIVGDESAVYNCTITGNSSSREGGGILATGNSVIVSNSKIINNTVNGEGPGIKVSGENASIANNYFIGNTGGQTGGIHIIGDNPEVSNNVIVRNYAYFLGTGGGVRVTGADAKIVNRSHLINI